MDSLPRQGVFSLGICYILVNSFKLAETHCRMELEKLLMLEQAANKGQQEMFRLGTALLFLMGIILFIAMRGGEINYSLMVAAMIGGYMALNIGANDVANNIGPAVGSRDLTLTGAIFIAAIFEAAGAIIAGGDVVSTIKSGIINPEAVADTNVFIWLMTAALLAGALWLNIATAAGAPASPPGAWASPPGAWTSPTGVRGADRRKLGHFSGAGRGDRSRLSLPDQAHHHLQPRHAAGGQKNGSHPAGADGLGLQHLSGDEGADADMESGLWHGCADRDRFRRGHLCHHAIEGGNRLRAPGEQKAGGEHAFHPPP